MRAMSTSRTRLHVTLEARDHRALKVQCASKAYAINEAVELLVKLWITGKVQLPSKGLHGAGS